MATEAAYGVQGGDAPAVLPLTLHFYRLTTFQGDPPPEQTSAMVSLDQICNTLRLVSREGAKADDITYFFERLLIIARGAFANQQFSPQGLGELDNLKEELVRTVGPDIKSTYIRNSIKWAFLNLIIIVSITATVYLSISQLQEHRLAFVNTNKSLDLPSIARWEDGYSIVHTGVMVGASIVGSLLAMMLRANFITYETLAKPPVDLTKPWLKFATYGIVAFVLSLLFQANVITFAIGDRFSTTRVSESLMIAMLIGLMVGIAEKRAADEVIKWSGEFMRRSSATTTS